MKKNNVTLPSGAKNVKEIFIRADNPHKAVSETFFIPQVFDKIEHLLIKKQLRFYKDNSKRAIAE